MANDVSELDRYTRGKGALKRAKTVYQSGRWRGADLSSSQREFLRKRIRNLKKKKKSAPESRRTSRLGPF